ncbi:MAG TPA: hypothetical protein VKE74_09890 [Gemmataceae bacterium]|nr:hypothetical protein [Gemmataceae bacterium]
MSSTGSYLVQFGKPGFVGRFRTADTGPLDRGARVVVRGPRGPELGTVLCEPAPRFQSFPDEGEILRPAVPEDDAAAERLDATGRHILAAAEESGLPLAFVDVELMLDGSAAILHALPWDTCDAERLFAELSARFGLAVRLLDLSRSPVAKDEAQQAGCGKPGCGSESGGCSTCGTGGGCSSGSCSRGAVKSPDELTAYFADLRRKMEEHAATRTPLV